MRWAFLPLNSHYSPIGNGVEPMLILKWPKKGVNMFNIRGADTQMVFGSVLDHFTQYWHFLALPEGQNGSFRVKMLLS